MPPTAPSASGASSLMKSCQPWVGMPNPTAVYALSCATCVESSAAPSMRENALRLPPVSAIAMHIGTPISLALASAAAITRWAASEVMVGTDTVSGMRTSSPSEPWTR